MRKHFVEMYEMRRIAALARGDRVGIGRLLFLYFFFHLFVLGGLYDAALGVQGRWVSSG